MARRLKLRQSLSSNIDYIRFGVYRLRIEVVEAEDMHAAIFIYQRKPPDPYTQEVLDEFVSVASIVDLSMYPPGAPDPTQPLPYFRQTWMELDLRAAQLVDSTWTSVIDMVNTLIAADAAVPQLTVTEEVWCGEPSDDGMSVSTSDSISW